MLPPRDADEPQHDVAQICLNGHVVNDSFLSYPQHNKRYCQQCGAETITTCLACNSPILGHYYYPDGANFYELPTPPFCHSCGSPFPWTASKLDAARELVDELELDIPEAKLLTDSIEELIRDTQKAQAAAARFSRLTESAKPVVMEGFKQILYSVLSEPVRKMIWPA